MGPRKIKDWYHIELLKTRVILILNFTRSHAITYTNNGGCCLAFCFGFGYRANHIVSYEEGNVPQ